MGCFAGAFFGVANGNGICCRRVCKYCLRSDFYDPCPSNINTSFFGLVFGGLLFVGWQFCPKGGAGF